MVFHWSLSDSKSPQITRTLLSILAPLNNAVVWIVSPRSPTSKTPKPFNNPLVTIPKGPIIIGIIVTFMFHSFFQFPSKVEVLILLFTFFQFYSEVSRGSKVDNFASSFFFIRYGLLVEIRWIVIIINIPFEFFTPALAGGLSLKSEWQDFSQYPNRSNNTLV